MPQILPSCARHSSLRGFTHVRTSDQLNVFYRQGANSKRRPLCDKNSSSARFAKTSLKMMFAVLQMFTLLLTNNVSLLRIISIFLTHYQATTHRASIHRSMLLYPNDRLKGCRAVAWEQAKVTRTKNTRELDEFLKCE